MSKHTDTYKEKMSKSVKNLETELNTIRAGRANPHVLDKITVDYYGTPTPLNQVGNISVPEARLIQIQPWDISVMKDIEKAINASDLGINPTNDGKLFVLFFLNLRRKEENLLQKMLRKKERTQKLL